MHPWKLKRLRRAMQTYLLEKYKVSEPPWQFDLACVFLDQEKRVAKVKFIENLINIKQISLNSLIYIKMKTLLIILVSII